jgi:hypothetical protein
MNTGAMYVATPRKSTHNPNSAPGSSARATLDELRAQRSASIAQMSRPE